MTKKQRKPNFLSGFIGNINAIKWLFAELKREFGCSNLCCNFVCQDCIENLFSEIRRRCGCNDAPNAYQFAAAFKYAALSASVKESRGTNCEPDKAMPLCDENDMVNEETVNRNLQETFRYKLPPLNEQYQATPRETNGLAYILGAAIRKLKHEKCRKQLTMGHSEFKFGSDSIHSFCKIKNVNCFPGAQAFDIGLLAFKAYKQFFSKFLHQNRRNVKTRLKQYLKYEPFIEIICNNCFQLLVDKIFNTLFQCFLRDAKNKLQNSIKTKRMQAKGKRNRKAIRMNLAL